METQALSKIMPFVVPPVVFAASWYIVRAF